MKKIVIIAFMNVLAICFSEIKPQSLDFGDAADPSFPTLLANDGARHSASPLYLGGNIDYEFDGISSPNGSGDDVNGNIDDEDGIIFNSWIIPGQSANINIIATGAGLINAWIDFNADGDWLDAGEKIFNDYTVSAGANNANFSVPALVSGNYIFARFRLSSAGGLQPNGLAVDGEVEDYLVYIGNPAAGNIVIKPDAGLSYCQNEISLTLEPVSGNLIAAFNDEPFPGGPGLGVAYSSDKGSTWTSLQLPYPNNPYSGIPLIDAFDPTVTCDGSGNVYVAHISTDYKWGNGPVSGLYVHKSVNGGAGWQTPVTVSVNGTATGSPDPNYRFNDRCQITADIYPSSSYFNNVYLAWIKDRGWNMPAPYSDIYFSYSSNGGTSFSAPVTINALSNAMGNMPVPAVAANGNIYVLWVDYNVITGGNGILMLDKSTNGGVTWGTDIVIDTIILPPLYLNNNSEVRAKGAAVIHTNPSVSNELYIVYAADPDTAGLDEADIFFIKSVDGGINWSQRIKINDDVTSNDQIMPWIDVKNSGMIEVAWYDRRNDPGDMMWDVYYSYSTDGGISFSNNMKLNSVSFASPQTSVGRWFGEYLGVVSDSTDVYVAYASSSIDVKGDIFFAKYANPAVSLKPLINKANDMFVNIFPNPVENILNITLNKYNINDICDVRIYNFIGELVYESLGGCNDKILLDISAFSKGIYSVSVLFDEVILVGKFVKQ